MSKVVPFETAQEVRDYCLCLHAQRTARALARKFDEVLRPTDLTNQQFSLLMALNRPAPPTMAPVADLLGLDRTTLTAALKPLERRGLVAVETDAADRRSRRIRLSAAGHAVLLRALPLWRQTQGEIGAENPAMAMDQLRMWLGELGSDAARGGLR